MRVIYEVESLAYMMNVVALIGTVCCCPCIRWDRCCASRFLIAAALSVC